MSRSYQKKVPALTNCEKLPGDPCPRCRKPLNKPGGMQLLGGQHVSEGRLICGPCTRELLALPTLPAGVRAAALPDPLVCAHCGAEVDAASRGGATTEGRRLQVFVFCPDCYRRYQSTGSRKMERRILDNLTGRIFARWKEAHDL